MKLIMFIFIAPIIFYSCDKSDSKKPKPCTTDAAAISGAYKITAATYKENASMPEIDYAAILLEPCEKDDLYTFNVNGTYHIADIGIACSPVGSDDGTWALTGSIMIIDGDPTTLESFDCKSLVLINTDINVAGDKLTITLKRQ